MGTNYYLRKNICECCQRYDELHIGKSSGGWNFSLRIYPDDGINTLEDWKAEFTKGKIFNEYGLGVNVNDMLETITEREKYFSNGEPLRSHVDIEKPGWYSGRVRKGEGTWDYCNYEFS